MIRRYLISRTAETVKHASDAIVLVARNVNKKIEKGKRSIYLRKGEESIAICKGIVA